MQHESDTNILTNCDLFHFSIASWSFAATIF